MAVVKRKGVAKSAGSLFKRSGTAQRGRAAKKEPVEEEAEQAKEVDEEREEEAEDAGNEGEEPEEEGEQDTAEQALARQEEELAAARKKELKAMPVGELKELVGSRGLETGKKEDMIEALVAHEAEARERERAHKAKIREVVVRKKEELEGLSVPELRDLCVAAGAKGILTKQARVELLMKRWQEEDGVDKALAKMARDAREEELVSMDKGALRQLCERRGIDAFVKEVMVTRIVRHESAQGRFAKPRLQEEEDEESEEGAQAGRKAGKAGDMVEALLANEANRKREREQRKQEEDASASKRKELRAMSIDELKKLLAKKGQEAAGKKEELVEALFAIGVQEEKVAAKKAKLKSLSLEDLKSRVTARGLEVGKKDGMVEALLAHEAKLREEAGAWETKIQEVLEKKRAELDEKTASELKELCAGKSLKLGVAKQDRIETLLEDARTSGEADKAIASMAAEARRSELLGMDRDAVLQICEGAGIDPAVKEVMVERIMVHEDEFGRAAQDADEEAEAKRPAKRARTSKK